MVGNPQILGLLEEMLDSDKTPEEVCRKCPELLPEVKQRWQDFQLIDLEVRTLLPAIGARPDGSASAPSKGISSPPTACASRSVSGSRRAILLHLQRISPWCEDDALAARTED